jgi:O-methyltransferase involved in polyketide biosynthesis
MDASKLSVNLTGASETLLIPLAARAQEARRPGSGYEDPRSLAFVERLDLDLECFTREWKTMATVVGRTKILDREVQAFFSRHPEGAQVVNVGCGLCTRFWRIDDGRVRWIDLDLPAVIALKRALVDETNRYTLMAADALGEGWLDAVPGDRPVLFVLEGFTMYFSAAQVKGLLTMLGQGFPRSEALIEVMSRFLLHMLARGTKSVESTGARLDFGMSRPAELEALVPGLEVLDHWLHADVHPEQWRFLRFFFPWFPPIHACMKVLHVRLGVA